MHTFLPRFVSALMAGAREYAHLGPALDTITNTSTAIGATLATATIASGDSNQVKNQAPTVPVFLLQVWADLQATGSIRVRSPKLHDNVDALRIRVQQGDLSPQLPWGVSQMLYPQDVLTVEHAGSATAGDIESSVMQIYYADLPGQNARLASWDQLKGRVRNLFGNRIAITLGSTAGYNGGRAINADQDLLKANTDYAVFGITTDTEAAAVCLRGPDTGNLRVSVPGENALLHHTAYWFKRLAIGYGLPLIPIINSANKGATLVDCVNDENGGTANVVVWLAELGA